MRHVDMRKLPAAAQEERRRQVIGLRQRGMTYQEIADLVGLSPTGVLNICKRRLTTAVCGEAAAVAMGYFVQRQGSSSSIRWMG